MGKKKKYNKKLLFELLQVNSPSYEEEKVAEIIIRELNGIGGFDIKTDFHGNVYAQRGESTEYPLLNAHMDIVELWDYGYYMYGKSKNKSKSYISTSKDVDYYEKEWAKDKYSYPEVDYLMETLGIDIIKGVASCNECISCDYCWGSSEHGEMCALFEPTFEGEQKIVAWADKYSLLDELYLKEDYDPDTDAKRYLISEQNGVISGKGEYRVLGGDDKCGIFIALEVARKTNIPMKLLFTVAEEIGCVGVDKFIQKNKKWFDDVKYSITIDRKDGDNLLLSQLGVTSCTKGFGAKLAMAGILEDIPVKVMDGSVSDVVSIREIVKDSVNISAGYHNPHDEEEYIKWDEVVKIINWVKRVVTDKTI